MKRKLEEQGSTQVAQASLVSIQPLPVEVYSQTTLVNFCRELDCLASFETQNSCGNFSTFLPAHLPQEIPSLPTNFSFSLPENQTPYNNASECSLVVPATSYAFDEDPFCISKEVVEQLNNISETSEHRLRPKRTSLASSRLFSADGESASDEAEDEEFEEEKTYRKNNSSTKKRPYYRKNKHSKEVLERVEAERLKRKRMKNRELAAKSRLKKKVKMQGLETHIETLKCENIELKKENAALKILLSHCKCKLQKYKEEH